MIVVQDSDDLLALYTPPGAPLAYPPGPWPTPNGQHPWHPKPAWEGQGMLGLQRPGEAHAVFHFWRGPAREFQYWYVNIQEPFRRTPIGIDTQDLELDIVIAPDGSWTFKDWELLDQRVREGRFTLEQAVDIRLEGDRIACELRAGRWWWDVAWKDWQPDPHWPVPALPVGWEQVPVPADIWRPAV
ncbi:MAG: DUF402 domain-containing protein [Chloroflexota bacterium]